MSLDLPVLEESDTQDVLARVSLMESLIEQGRQGSRRWGEFGVLWGVGTLLAFVSSTLTRGDWHPWLWLNALAVPLTAVLLLRRMRMHRTITQTMRFVNALWLVTGVACTLAGFAACMSRQITHPAISETIFLLLGTANLVSGYAFRWPLQFAVGTLFFLAAMALVFVTGSTYFWTYCATVFLGEVCFGVYLMLTEGRNAYE